MPRGIPNKKVTEETNKKIEENVEAKIEEKAEEVKEEKTETKKTTRKTTASKTTTAELEKEKSVVDSIYGELLDMTEREDNFFPSGSLVIDSVLSNGKGIPMGKFISINSESGIGKTTCCLHIARNCCSKGYRCLYIDTECGLNRSQLESFSMIPFLENRTFIPKYVRTYRELDDLLKRVQNDENLKFIFIDSLTDIIPDQLIENNISDVNQPALNAVMQSRILAKYKFPLSNAGITTFFVLQNRTKIGMTYTQPTTVQAAGGKSVEYHMDITLELTKKEFLTRTIKGHDKPIPYGAECFLKANKNRHVPPKIPMLLQVIFGKGVSNSGAIANAMVLNGLAKASSKKYTVDYKGEEVVLLSKAKFDAFIKEHLEYYKAIVESCGGIKLIPDSEMIQPVTETNTEEEDSIEELSVEESGYEADEDGIISLE